jgi:trigger factor
METIEKPMPAKVKVVKEEPCEITFSIELPKEEVTKETDAVFHNIQSRASLPGFRTGKAPMELVKRNFTDKARQTILENLIGRAAGQVIRERKLQTIDTPRVEKLEFEFDKPLSFHMKVEKDPEVKAKDYKGIKVNRPSDKVTDEMAAKTLEEVRERNASLAAAPADAKITNKHFAVIDFDGKIEGKPFPGGSAKDYLLDMSAPQTIAGFSEGVLGAALGEKRSVSVSFPADYGRKEYAGKQAIFEVSIKEIKEKKMPTLDDEFAKDLGFASIQELRQKARESLEKEEGAKADKDVEEQLFQALLDTNSFPVPPTLVEERTKSLTQRALNNLMRQGLVQQGDAQAEKTILEKSKPQAERDVRLSYLLKSIATQEKLEAADSDIEDLKKKSLEENKDRADQVQKYFNEHAASIRASLTEGKVLEFLKKSAKIKAAKE